MFAGIITHIGRLTAIKKKPDGGVRLWLGTDEADTLAQAKLGDSLACNGVCLTIAELDRASLGVDVSPETLAVTTAGGWQTGQALNLEAALRVGDALGGHFVTGHVDGIGTIEAVDKQGDNWRVVCHAPQALARFLAKKGSLAMDGVSLTVNSVADQADGRVIFSVMLIPHTWQNTILRDYGEGVQVNLEADILARYALRADSYKNTGKQ